MMISMNKNTALLLLGLSLSSHVWALDLTEAYQRALNYDASWQANQTRYQIEQQNLGIAKGAVLPTVSVNASVYKQFQEIDEGASSMNMGGQPVSFMHDETTGRQIALSLRQPLFRMDVWQKYKQVQISTELAELDLERQKQEILLEVAKSYFNVLRQQNLLELAQKEENSLLKQYNMMSAKLKEGLVARMEVSEAQAQYQSASAKRVNSEIQQQLAEEKLQQMIGEYQTHLADLSPEFQFQTPYPTQLDEWMVLAERNNLALNQKRAAYRVAEQQIKIDQADYYPQIEAVATSAWSKQSPQNMISADGRNDKIALEMNWTPYTGTRSKITEKSRLSAAAAQQDIDVTLRQVRTDLKSAYLQVATASSQLEAYKVAMASAQLVSDASQASYQEGLKTMVDVLLAQRSAFAAQQDYIHAQYDYVLNVLHLKATSGQLTEKDLDELNAWLIQS